MKAAVDSGECLLEWDYTKGEPTAPLLKDCFGSERRRAKVLSLLTTYLLPTTSLLLVGAQPTYYLLFTTRYAPITKCFHHALRTARCAHCALTKYYSHQVLNFSIAYGKTAHGLSKDWGVTQTEAQVSGACQLQVSTDRGDARPSLALTLTV